MKPRVVLFYPRTGWDVEGVTIGLPLSVLYVAAPLVADGLDVVILDDRLLKESRQAIQEALRGGENIVAFGISSMTGVQISHGLKAAAVVKDVAPSIPIVWGGIHPTILSEQTLSHSMVDYIVVGEGENSFREFIQRRLNGGVVEEVAGIGSKNPDGAMRINPEGPAVDLDAQPPLPYDLIEMPRYITTKIFGEKDMIIMSSRGCPHNCAYCYQCNPKINNRWRAYSPTRVVDMVQEMQTNYGLDAIMLQDDLFFGKRSWVEEFCNEILKREIKITFRADCRVDYLNSFSDDFLRLVRKAGLKYLYLGVESGSDRILEMIHKNTTAEEVRKAALRMKEFDIIPHFSFMAGFPGEAMEDVYKTLSLMLEVVTLHPQARTSNLQLYNPYPGTEFWDRAIERGIKAPQRLEDWAETNWNRSISIWFNEKERDFLELASYFSYFIDGKTVASWYGGNALLRFLNSMYTRLVRFRVRHRFYRFITMGRVIRWLKEKGFLK